MNESGALAITFASVDRRRGHVAGLVRAHQGDVLIHAATVRLDSPEERYQFAIAVVELAEGATVASGRVEMALLAELDRVLNLEQERVDDDEGGSSRGPSQADLLVGIGRAAELFADPAGAPFARLQVGTHYETWAIKSTGFRRWLLRQFWEKYGKAPSGEAIAAARNVLEAQAQFDGPTRPVYLRVAPDGVGGIVIDLGDPDWRVVHITPAGWRIVSDLSSISFRRSAGTLALPTPTRGGSLDDLRALVNVEDPDGWARIKAWLRRAAHPEGPYPLLALYGEQGSAKTTTARLLVSLIDPATPSLRSDPRDLHDLVIAAQSRHVVGLDNVSSLPSWLSDALCRLATGGGWATRELYSDQDEVLFAATRPVLLTGITEYIGRGDLLDRALQETLTAISQEKRRRESELLAAFDAARPALIGSLFDDLAAGLRAAPGVELPSLPRMADFAHWAVACELGRGEPPRFVAAYEVALDGVHLQAIEASGVGPTLMRLLASVPTWEGTAEELLTNLTDLAGPTIARGRSWPRSGRGLSGELRRLAPALRGIGAKLVTDQREAHTGRRLIHLEAPAERPNEGKREKDAAAAAGEAPQPSPSSPGRFHAADQEGAGVTVGEPSTVTGPSPVTVEGSPVTVGDGWGDGLTRDGDGGDGPSAPPAGGRDFIADAGSVRLVESDREARRVVADLLTLPVVGLDTETLGLDPRQDRLRLVQLATTDGKVFIFDLFRLDVHLLAPLFEASCGPILVAHNAKFDLGFLAAAGLPVPSHTRLFDTILAALLIEASAATPPRGYFGLEGVVSRFLGVELDKTEQVSDWSGPLSAPQLDYAAIDAAVMVPLHAVLAEQLREHDLERVFRLEMRALPAVVWLEANGAPFDADAWMVLAEQAVRRQLESEQRLSQEAGTLGDDGVATLNWRSPQQVGKLLAERGHVVPNVTEDTLLGLADVEPLARLLLDYREAAKKVGTYGLAFLKHLHPTTGRIHPDWQQLRSRAGRMACSKPNLQQVPKMPAYRACFKPSAGRVLVKADYSQIELRIAAQLAPDARLIAAYQAGEDVHTITAGEVLGRTNGSVTTGDRQAAKAINFGLLFGCGAATLRASAKSQFGVELSEAEAVQFRSRFFDVFAGIKAWHRRQPGRDRPIDTRSLAGRRRLGVANFSEQLNTPVQGSGADGFKAGLALLWETRERCPSALPVLVVHDEVVVECDEADADLARDWLVDCLTRGMEAFLTEVPVVVETSIALDWSGSPLLR